jgi:Tol biopolymer transport system component
MRTNLLLGTVLAAGLSWTAAVPASAAQGPDNGRISFSRFDPSIGARTIWVADSDGRNPEQLVTGSFSDWSPDGTRIAFDFEDGTDSHIATIGVDGQRRVTLTSEPGIQDSPDWSPDGQWVAFNAEDRSLPFFSTSIWMVRADGTDARRVTSGGFDVEPVFSPDSRQIAFARIVADGDDDHPQVNSLHVVNTDGSGLREVVPARAGLEHPDWSPDGKWLGFNIDPGNRQLADSGSLVAVRPDGKALHVLRARTADLGFFKIGWSPDGKRLLMGCFDSRVQRDRLCTSTAGGGGVRPIEMADNSWVNHPAWGPMP